MVGILIFFCQFEILQEDPVNLEITLIWSQSFISIAYQQILLIFCIDRFRNRIYFPESDPTHVSGTGSLDRDALAMKLYT